MKYIEARPSSKDKDVNVYLFAFNKEELEVLRVIAKHYRKQIPKTIGTASILGRLRIFEKAIRGFNEIHRNILKLR